MDMSLWSLPLCILKSCALVKTSICFVALFTTVAQLLKLMVLMSWVWFQWNAFINEHTSCLPFCIKALNTKNKSLVINHQLYEKCHMDDTLIHAAGYYNTVFVKSDTLSSGHSWENRTPNISLQNALLRNMLRARNVHAYLADHHHAK